MQEHELKSRTEEQDPDACNLRNESFLFPILEVCIDSVESALTAAKAGARRLELCSSLISGGLTPSQGTIVSVLHSLKENDYNCKQITVHCMIRPRGADFHYSNNEINTILCEIDAICEIKKKYIEKDKIIANMLHGLVFGFLKKDGTIDSHIIELCQKRITDKFNNINIFQVTFHRAIDMSDFNKLNSSLETLHKLKINRILTSGFCNNITLCSNLNDSNNSINSENNSIQAIIKMIDYCNFLNYRDENRYTRDEEKKSENRNQHIMHIAIGGGINENNIELILFQLNKYYSMHHENTLIPILIGIHGTFRSYQRGKMVFKKNNISMSSGYAVNAANIETNEYGNKFACFQKINLVHQCIHKYDTL